ncbi:alpha/beta hydrolase [Nonomuraea sp. NPDC050643]|uniref:alpha/beta hydrolase n=1 Tax=Nonomuraea sp. NPDC050643 TaxID=3155660 RepID=UPI00340B8D74
MKVQAAGLYAERLAGHAFATLAFDAAHQGESEGEPRLLEDPFHRVEDIKAAAPAPLQQIRPDTAPDHREQAGTLARHTFDGWEYYRTPAAANHFVLRSIDLLAQFTAFDLVHLIAPRPLLMIAGTEAITGYFSREAIDRAAEPKRLAWIDGATHVDLYDNQKHLPAVIAKPAAFFTTHLDQAQ